MPCTKKMSMKSVGVSNMNVKRIKIELQNGPKMVQKWSKRVKIEHQKGSEMKLKWGRSEAEKASQTRKL